MNTDNNFQMYQNSGYVNKRNRKKTLVIDYDDTLEDHLGAGTEFSIDLREPLIIDKHSEVYLDNFLTFNCNLGDTHNQAAFCLKINEFKMNTGIASKTSEDTITDSIIIPNDNNNIDNYFGTVVHKGKKFNYICDINPQTISQITGKITDLDGNPIFHGDNAAATRFTYALTGIDDWGSATDGTTKRALYKGDILTSISPVGGTASGITTRILTNTVQGADTIFFTSKDVLDPDEWDGVNISFVVDAANGHAAYNFTIQTASNQSIMLLKQNGRFIAEFSIISRE
tara:strand:+ start:48 stop:902 length:855 start_codon:yes stop_codon:yes gene_type:complete